VESRVTVHANNCLNHNRLLCLSQALNQRLPQLHPILHLPTPQLIHRQTAIRWLLLAAVATEFHPSKLNAHAEFKSWKSKLEPFQPPSSTEALQINKDAQFQTSRINVTRTHASTLVSEPPMDLAII